MLSQILWLEAQVLSLGHHLLTLGLQASYTKMLTKQILAWPQGKGIIILLHTVQYLLLIFSTYMEGAS